MSIQKPNCSTCTLKECPDDTPMDDFGASGEESVKLLKNVGCLSHPNAREYLMQDVVKELNQREHNLGMHLTEREKGKCDGYNEAIALIRDGVKK